MTAECVADLYDPDLAEAVSAVRVTHEEVGLAELTDWGWDEVFFFEPYDSASQIEAVAGQPIITDIGLNDDELLLFMKEGSPVRAVTGRWSFAFTPNRTPLRFTNVVRVVPIHYQSGDWDLLLLEPVT